MKRATEHMSWRGGSDSWGVALRWENDGQGRETV